MELGFGLCHIGLERFHLLMKAHYLIERFSQIAQKKDPHVSNS